MKTMQSIKGYKLTANTTVDILDTFNAPIVLIQNHGDLPANITFNNGEPLYMRAIPFAYEPLVAIYGYLSTDNNDVVVFA